MKQIDVIMINADIFCIAYILKYVQVFAISIKDLEY